MATVINEARPVGNNLLQTSVAVDYTELTAAATTQTIDLVTLPTGAEILFGYVDLVTVFADAGSITAIGLEVGSTADPDSIQTSTELLSGPPSTGRVRSQGAGETGDGLAVKAKFTATGANFGDGATTDVDAGKVVAHLFYRVV